MAFLEIIVAMFSPSVLDDGASHRFPRICNSHGVAVPPFTNPATTPWRAKHRPGITAEIKRGPHAPVRARLTLAAFPALGSSQDGRRAESGPILTHRGTYSHPPEHPPPLGKQRTTWPQHPHYRRPTRPVFADAHNIRWACPPERGLQVRSTLEDSDYGSCHTPGTRAGSQYPSWVLNFTSSVTKPSHPVDTG